MKLSAVMPAFNEAETIEKTVRYCFEVLRDCADISEVVVTNDGSRDATGEILLRLQQEFPDLVVITHSPNQGYGAALARAMDTASGDIIVSLDSDGQFDIADIRDMLPFFSDDVAILTGYRQGKKDSLLKVFADRVMNRMIRILFSVSYRDTNCALKLYRGALLHTLPLEARGFQLPTEIVLKAHALGWVIRECPVRHYPRAGGQSSLAPFRTAWRMLVFLAYLRRKITLYKKGIIRSL
ncbi:glycosyltransferase family 2 protein [bacterium]|nr:glycosyltransferase family 2 protein [candidate division CSSED10-310 bacterium]